MLKPNESQQNEALLAAMSEILWNIGEKLKATVALPGDVPLIAHSHTYFQDSVTEKVNRHLNELMTFKFGFVNDFSSYLSLNWRNWKICKFSSRDICISWVEPTLNHMARLFENSFSSHTVYWGSWCWSFAVPVQCSDDEDTVKVLSLLPSPDERIEKKNVLFLGY